MGGVSYLTDLMIELLEDGDNAEACIKLAAICIAGVGMPQESGKLIALSQLSVQRWKVWGAVELPTGVDEIECHVLSGGYETIGSVLLDGLGRPNDTSISENFSKQFETFDPPFKYSVSWGTFETTFEEDPEVVRQLLEHLANSYSEYQRGPSTLDLSGVIAAVQRVIDMTPEASVKFPSYLYLVGLLLCKRCESSGDSQDLDQAVSAKQKAVRLTPIGDEKLPSRLDILGSSLVSRFQRTHDLKDLSEAISIQTRAAQLTPDGEAVLLFRLHNLAELLMHRFHHIGEPGDITQAISLQSQVVHATPKWHEERPCMLSSLGEFFLHRFRRTSNLEDIAKAIRLHSEAAHLAPEGSPGLPCSLTHLGESFLHRFQHTGNFQDLVEAMSFHCQAVHLAPEGHPDLPRLLNNLGTTFTLCFEHSGNLQDITESISLHNRAAQLIPDMHPHHPIILHHLATSFYLRFDRTGNLQDLREAISLQSKAVGLTPERDPNLPIMLGVLGRVLLGRFDCMGTLGDALEAISVLSKATQLTPEGSANRPFILRELADSFQRRFHYTGELRDITQAITLHSQVLRLVPEGHVHFPAMLGNLGNVFGARSIRTGNLEDIVEAIGLYSQAVNLTPEGSPDLPSSLNGLGCSLLQRFRLRGDLQDTIDAISLLSRAVSLTPKEHPKLPSYLSQLGATLCARFEISGDLQDISEAISLRYQAIQLIPDRHPLQAEILGHLAISLHRRFMHTRDLQDIEEAIRLHSKAIGMTPEGHTNLPFMMSALAGSFLHRFQCTDEPHDLSEAISVQSHAIKLTPEGDASLPNRLRILGSSFVCLFEKTGDLAQVTEGISLYNQAMQLIPQGALETEGILSNLASAMSSRFGQTGDPQDIIQAIHMQTKAVRLTPDGHADLPPKLKMLGDYWYQAFISSRRPEHMHSSIFFNKLAATRTFGHPIIRVNAAITWVRLLELHHGPAEELVTVVEIIIRQLALIAGIEQTVQRRHTMIRMNGTVPHMAASVAFRLNRTDKALEWLEQGRCLVWGQQAQLRTPVDKLHIRDAPLADRVVTVARQLENAGSSSRARDLGMPVSQKISMEHEARDHMRLAGEWEALLVEVRSIPGFEDFLQPLPIPALLQHLPTSGHVVVINVNVTRCDAIALQAGSDEPLHIPLPLFSLKKAQHYRNILGNQLRCYQLRARGGDTMRDRDIEGSERAVGRYRRRGMEDEGHVHMVLRCLWVEIVKPILNGLGLLPADRSSADPLPRIWWCPTGPLSFLPIHAAGNYRGVAVESAMDHVVSSYTPTVTAITKMVSTNHKIDPAVSGIFLTSQPKPNGEVPIPGTTKEVESICKKAKGHGLRTSKFEGGEVSAAECLELMEEFSSVHLACHAVQNGYEPLKSCFVFHKGKLDLQAIMQRDLKNADLAFLSACQTGTGDDTLSDEAVHLAAGMLAAGYRRVVATMWGIKDNYAPKVADDFYDYLWQHGSGDGPAQFDGSLSAHALHHAIQNLRESLGNADTSLLSWIPYVHFGY